MNNSVDLLKAWVVGKRTYLVALVAGLYLVGCWAGVFTFDEKVLAGLGFAGLATLRAGLASLTGKLGGWVLAASLIAAASGGAGCATTNTPGRVLATTAVTVDGAMKGWGEWVALGKATTGDEAKVKAAYETYQTSFSLALKAYQAASGAAGEPVWVQAAATLKGCQVDLLGVIDLLSGGKAAVKK